MQLRLHLSTLLLLALQRSSAQEGLQEKVWSVLVYNLHGDSTPHTLANQRTLTPLGALQLYGAGYAIRNRYVSHSGDGVGTATSSQVSGISPFVLANEELEVLSTTDQSISASALAFMQGLYPRSAELYQSSISFDEADLVNGTAMDFPLGGYQYPNIVSVGERDPTSTYLSGHVNCPGYAEALTRYVQSAEAEEIRTETAPFYADMYSRILHGVFTEETANYNNAEHVFDYLNYEYIHNETARDIITWDELDRARYLADQRAFAGNGNRSAVGVNDEGNHMNSIAGMTLAQYIVEALERNIRTRGTANKLSLLFGSFEPMVALASLLGLPSDRQPNFYGRPNPGASMVIELFSLEATSSAEYPSSDTDLMVRFLLRNGTAAWDVSTPLVSYPMFGHSAHQSTILYKEFLGKLVDVSTTVSGWCRACNSLSVFCPAYIGTPTNSDQACKPCSSSPSTAGIAAGVSGACIMILVWIFVSCCPCARRSRQRLASRIWKNRRRSKEGSQYCSGRSASWNESLEMDSGNVGGTSDRSTKTNPTCEDDEELLVNPATQPVKVRETV